MISTGCIEAPDNADDIPLRGAIVSAERLRWIRIEPRGEKYIK
jgi:hypothetical protein